MENVGYSGTSYDIVKLLNLKSEEGSSSLPVASDKRANNLKELDISGQPVNKQRFTVAKIIPNQPPNLNRLKSSSYQDLKDSSSMVQAETRRRANSITALTYEPRPSSNKQYIPVEHPDLTFKTHSKANRQPQSNYDTVTSFADFIKVRNKKSNGAPPPPYEFAKKSKARNMRRRLIYKNGDCNVTHKHIRKVKRHYLADIFTTLIDLQWRWALLIYIASFILTWLLFACIWYIIAYTHKDLDPNMSHTPCVAGVTGFATAFLFSLETQHTIGYGTRATTGECTEAIIIQMIQSITGVLAQALVTGMIYAKVSKPKRRAETLMFSKDAVISCRDGQLCLMFRIGDMRSSHLVEAHVRALLIRRRITKEGEVLPLDHQDVDLGLADGSDRLLIIWPIIVIHKIDKNSPFWRMSQSDLERENFELIVILEGTIESTGMTTQARTSYLPSEILWGRRLERLVTFQKEGGEYQVDYTRFDNTVPVETPSCSAKELLSSRSRDNVDNDSSSGEEYTLMRADTDPSSDDDEDEHLLVPEGGIALDVMDADATSKPLA